VACATGTHAKSHGKFFGKLFVSFSYFRFLIVEKTRFRKLTLEMIRKISDSLHIPTDFLVQEYIVD